ncbi:MAG: two-component regulator propeller domain-containing protein [Prolixibacteraceae bacterium]|nr:two-component regulator propeller domain-containing protein [Prolixibacteraceae bacterium]
MSTYKIFSVLLALFLLVQTSGFLKAQDDDIYFESLSPELGLSQITVACIYQDTKGLMWFGTEDGLNRFDGYRFEVFKTSQGDEKTISNNIINGITEDPAGFIWVATERGLNRYCHDTGEFLRFYKSTDKKGISHDKVSFIHRDKKGNLWIGTEQGIDFLNNDSLTFTKNTFNNFLFNNRIISIRDDSYGNLWIGTLKGLVKYTPENGNYQIFRHQSGIASSLSDNHVRSIFEDSNKTLWIATRNGLNVYDPRNKNFLHFGKTIYPDRKLSNNAVRCMTEDSEKNLLIGTNEGLNIFNIETKELKKYNQKKMIRGNLNHFFVYSLFIDHAETVWIGTYSGGINYYNRFTQQFRYFNPGNNFVFGNIGPVAEQNNEFWIATGGGGLLNYDRHFNYKGQFLLDQGQKSYVSNVVRSIYSDNGGKIYIGTEENQLLCFDPASKKITNRANGFMGIITKFYKSSDEKIWLCVNDTTGLRIFNPQTFKTEQAQYRNNAGNTMILPYATSIVEDSPGSYWVGTRYTGIYLYNTKRNSVTRRFTSGNNATSLQSNYITDIHIDTQNNIWVGTNGGGLSLFDRQTETFKTYTEADGLQNMNIYGILEDAAGFLWISTLSGISRFDPVRNEFKNYTKSNGFPLYEMNEQAFTMLSDGRITAGGNNGFTVFDPLRIRSNEFVPPVHITSFRLLRSEKTGSKPVIEKKYIHDNDEIRLKHNQSSFIIEYTALNYIFPEKNQYAYQLEGFDPDWNYVDKQRIAIYTNLNSGKYVFRVKASNNDGVWNEAGKAFSIKVSPPPWRSWWAYILYFLSLTGIFILLLHYLRLENRIKIKQFEQDNMEKTHQVRIRMFTNFSHELRTPLTLIMGPLEDLLNRQDLPDFVRGSLHLIQKNTHRLLLLVNQLMDFRKQESGNMKLKAAEGRFNKFITEISMAFNELAFRQKIDYSTQGNQQDIRLWFDRFQLEKVFFNLLSNAFKNTPQNGKITLTIVRREKAELKDMVPEKRDALLNIKTGAFIETAIRNTGKGIPFKDLDKIFDPFYQVAEDGQSSAGTGIGLSLVKGIVELHHGIVFVESLPGEGACFRVFLPEGNQHLSPDEIITDYIGSEHIDHYLLPDSPDADELPEPPGDRPKKYTILVIDDNADIRRYIKSQLQNTYNILEASNGKEGVEKAARQIPDLVISDIMMPEIDGLQLCLKLKNDVHTSHIPIILLTARTTYQQVKEGFDVGADDYITKPFNSNMLRIKINSVISNRERLRQSFGKKLPFELPASETNSTDELFLKKIYQIIEKNISNPDFDIEHFSDEIGMSRASLYRKIKSLTNCSPNEFIKNYRLQVALKYLRETDLPISEISYKTGFNTPAYFTNCFKKAHKVSPSEYLQNMNTPGKRKHNE